MSNYILAKCLKLCVAMPLTAKVSNETQDVSSWNSEVLNTFLMHGNSLYTGTSNSIIEDVLLLTDVPVIVSLAEAIYCLQCSESCIL